VSETGRARFRFPGPAAGLTAAVRLAAATIDFLPVLPLAPETSPARDRPAGTHA